MFTCTTQGAQYSLVKSNAECKSGDNDMGKKVSVQDCANAVSASDGFFFIFGTGSKAGNCWKESTGSEACTEGWETDSYDFYKLEARTNTIG